MELEIMLSEINQSHKDKYSMFSLICGSQGKTNKTTNQGHENRKETTREREGKGKEEGRGKSNTGGDMIKVYYLHVWKCHDETLTVYNLILINKINKLIFEKGVSREK
jgi:hypothetical protein